MSAYINSTKNIFRPYIPMWSEFIIRFTQLQLQDTSIAG